MNKKQIVALATCVATVALSVAGATLAYFTDTDTETNTFAVGNVSIDLIEQQRGEKDGEKTLVDFEQGKKLYPIVGSAQGKKDEFGQPTAENYVDKIVTVKNTGTEDAYIRAYFAIPSALDDGKDTFNAGLNVLHFNYGDKKSGDDFVTTYGNEWIWNHTADGTTKWNYFETTIGGIAYNVYFADYYTTVAAGVTTEQFVKGVYLDKSFDSKTVYNETTKKNEDKYYAFGKELTLDDGWKWSEVKCPVFAVAVQAAGFDSADAAVTAAFGAQYNPWGTTVSNWQ